MNPLTKVKLINELNEKEAHLGIKDSVSWHSEYKDSAWIFIGGFPYELTEGDIICVFSQYGEIANINLVRDKKTGKSKGFCFLCYEDQRSTILAVDNFNGIKIKGRTIRVDHVSNYRPPKDSEDIDDVTKRLREEGCAPKVAPSSELELELLPLKKPKKDKKEKKKKEKKEKKKDSKEEKRAQRDLAAKVKKEKEDAGYEKYVLKGAHESRGQDTRSSRERTEDRRRGERERSREEKEEEERRTGKGRDEQRPREDRERGRDGERDSERDRTKERHRERDGEKERDGDRHREKWRDREYRRN